MKSYNSYHCTLNSFRTITPPRRIMIDHYLSYCISKFPDAPVWYNIDSYRQAPVFIPINRYTAEYQYVANLFYSTTEHLQIYSIERIENPYLMSGYLLKKRQLYNRYGYVDETTMFHATRSEYVQSICENNFNWRFYGLSRGHKYGKGVSFSPRAGYAHMFSDKKVHLKVMFLADVLMNNTCMGHQNMSLPNYGSSSSQKDRGAVIVKYEDNEFYPKYVICYIEHGHSFQFDTFSNYVTDGFSY